MPPIVETPAHIAIDTGGPRGRWFSLAGAELVRWMSPLRRPLLSFRSAHSLARRP